MHNISAGMSFGQMEALSAYLMPRSGRQERVSSGPRLDSERSGRFLVCVIVAALMALPAHAGPTDELVRLRQEAARMRQSLDVLDARIRALENGNSPARAPGESDRSVAPPTESTLTPPMPNTVAVNPPNSQSVSPLLLLQRNWSEIKPGMSKEQVDALLGKPERVMRINGDLTWYYVHPGFGRGSVFFDDEGKVSSAQSPHLGWSW
jgi:hypothetical protein